MKRRAEIAISCIMTGCILLAMLHFIVKLVERKDSYFKYEPFYEQEEDFDVLFMGTSHVVDAVFPMELWKDYGIVSYNFGGHGNYLPITYWVMKNALEYTTPKLMVVDCFFLGQNELILDIDQQHISMDHIPFSKLKFYAVMDTVEDKARQADFLWDFSIYHNRWNALDREDFEGLATREKGAESRVELTKALDISEGGSSSRLEEETTGVQYLKKIIEECQERDIEVLLTYLPSPAIEEFQKEVNTACDIAKEYGVRYLDFCNLDLINYETDCSDRVFHLNPSGARKVTDYLGEYIMEHYEIPDRRKDLSYMEWEESYKDYENFKLECMAEQESLDTYLMLQADKNYDLIIEVNNREILKEELYCELLQNLGVETGQLSDNTDFLFIGAGGEEAVCAYGIKAQGGFCDTPLGEAGVYGNDEGAYGVYLNGEEIYVVPRETEYDFRILTFRAGTDILLADARAVYSYDEETEKMMAVMEK